MQKNLGVRDSSIESIITAALEYLNAYLCELRSHAFVVPVMIAPATTTVTPVAPCHGIDGYVQTQSAQPGSS